MAQANARISVGIDTGSSLAQLRALEAQISSFNNAVLRSSDRAVASQLQFNAALQNAVISSKNFTTSIVKTSTEVDRFSTRLEKNKFSMGEYFKYGASQVGMFRRVFANEFDTVERVATERVKRLQTQFISLGTDAQGVGKSLAIIPRQLDMTNPNTQMAIAGQRMQIFNKLVNDGSTQLLNFGKNTQWAGRQLMVGFTIPLSIFGGLAAKTFMDLEKQATRFRKVYGDLFTSPEETEAALAGIREIGNEYTKYGIKVEETIGLASQAAATGLTGVELQKATTETLRLATLGEIEYGQALDTTIALQNAFKISSDDLAESIDFLNAVENQTVVSLSDITEAIPRVAPVIKGLGGDIKDLAAFLAAMQEGGVNAAEGANALKSGLASLINPTDKAVARLEKMGINLKAIINTNRGDLMGTVQAFGEALSTLSEFQRQQALEQVFGKFQFARLGALFNNIIDSGSQAQRVMDLAGYSAEELAKLSEGELAKISESTTARFEGAVERLRVAIAPIGELFLQIVTPLAEIATTIADKFSSLPDGVKKAIAIIVAAIAGIAPVALMTFGLVANGIANGIKALNNIRIGFMKLSGLITGNRVETEYWANAELDAAAASASLEGRVETLTNSIVIQSGAVQGLITDLSRLATQAQTTAASMPQGFAFLPGAAGMKAAKTMATGGFVAGTGNEDSEPALLMPGEFVVNKKAAEQYGPVLQAMNAGTLKGYALGTESRRASYRGTELPISGLTEKQMGQLEKMLARLEAWGVDTVHVLDVATEAFVDSGMATGKAMQKFKASFEGMASFMPGGTNLAHMRPQEVPSAAIIKEILASGQGSMQARQQLEIYDAVNDILGRDVVKAGRRSNLVYGMEEISNKLLASQTGIGAGALATSMGRTGVGGFGTLIEQGKLLGLEQGQLASQADLLTNKLIELLNAEERNGIIIKDTATAQELAGGKVKTFGQILDAATTDLGQEIGQLKSLMDTLDSEFSQMRVTVASLTEQEKLLLAQRGYQVTEVVGRSGSGRKTTRYDITRMSDQASTSAYAGSLKSAQLEVDKVTDYSKVGGSKAAKAWATGFTGAVSDVAKQALNKFKNSPHPYAVASGAEDGAAWGRAFATAAGTQMSLFDPDPIVGPGGQQYLPGMENEEDLKRSTAKLSNANNNTADKVVLVGDEMTPAQTATRKLSDESQKTTGKMRNLGTKIQGMGGRLFGLTMAIDAVAMGATAMGVDLGEGGQKALMGLNALGMLPFGIGALKSIVPLLMNPVGLAIAAIGGLTAAIWFTNKKTQEMREKTVGLSIAMDGSAAAFRELSKELGTLRPTQRFDAIFAGVSTEEQQAAKTAGQQYLESESGKAMLERLGSLGGMQRKATIEKELLDSLALGIIDPTQAKGIAAAVAESLKDPMLGQTLVQSISQFVSRNSRDVTNGIKSIIDDASVSVDDIMSKSQQALSLQNEMADLLRRRAANDIGGTGTREIYDQQGNYVGMETLAPLTEAEQARLEELQSMDLTNPYEELKISMGPLMNAAIKLAEAQAQVNLEYRNGKIDLETYNDLTGQITTKQQQIKQTLALVRDEANKGGKVFRDYFDTAALALGITDEELVKINDQADAIATTLADLGYAAADTAGDLVRFAMATGELSVGNAATLPTLMENKDYKAVLDIAIQGDDPTVFAQLINGLNYLEMLPEPLKTTVMATFKGDWKDPAAVNAWLQQTRVNSSYVIDNPRINLEIAAKLNEDPPGFTTEYASKLDAFYAMGQKELGVNFNIKGLAQLEKSFGWYEKFETKPDLAKEIWAKDEYSPAFKAFGATYDQFANLPNLTKAIVMNYVTQWLTLKKQYDDAAALWRDATANPYDRAMANRAANAAQGAITDIESSAAEFFSQGSGTDTTTDTSGGGSKEKSPFMQLLETLKQDAEMAKMIKGLEGKTSPELLAKLIALGAEGLAEATKLFKEKGAKYIKEVENLLRKAGMKQIREQIADMELELSAAQGRAELIGQGLESGVAAGLSPEAILSLLTASAEERQNIIERLNKLERRSQRQEQLQSARDFIKSTNQELAFQAAKPSLLGMGISQSAVNAMDAGQYQTLKALQDELKIAQESGTKKEIAQAREELNKFIKALNLAASVTKEFATNQLVNLQAEASAAKGLLGSLGASATAILMDSGIFDSFSQLADYVNREGMQAAQGLASSFQTTQKELDKYNEILRYANMTAMEKFEEIQNIRSEIANIDALQITDKALTDLAGRDIRNQAGGQLDTPEAIQREIDKITWENIVPDEREIARIQRLIEPLERLNELDQRKIEEQNDLIDNINKQYDEQLKALEKIEQIEQSIFATRQAQLNIAGALSRGDVAAAAQAMLDAQRTNAEQQRATARQNMEAAREAKIAKITAEIDKLNADIESRKKTIQKYNDDIYNLEKNISDIEYNKIRILQQQLDLYGYETGAADTISGALNLQLAQERQLNGYYATRTAELRAQIDLINSANAALAQQNAIKAQQLQAAQAVAAPAAPIPGVTVPGTLAQANVAAGKPVTIADVKAQQFYESRMTQSAIQSVINRAAAGDTATFRAREWAVIANNIGRAATNMYGGKILKMAYGSTVPGMGNTDRVPAFLTPGEYVVKKSAAAQFMPLLEAINGAVYPNMSGISGAMPKNYNDKDSGEVYNYSINVNAGTNVSADDIANAVMTKIKLVDGRRVKGYNY